MPKKKKKPIKLQNSFLNTHKPDVSSLALRLHYLLLQILLNAHCVPGSRGAPHCKHTLELSCPSHEDQAGQNHAWHVRQSATNTEDAG